MTTTNEMVSAAEAQGLLQKFARGREKGAATDVWGLFDKAEDLARTVIAREAEVTELRTRLGRFALATASLPDATTEPVEGTDLSLYVHTSTGMRYARLRLAAVDPSGKAAVVLAPVEGGPVVVYPADTLDDPRGCFRALAGDESALLSAHLRVLQPLVKTVEPILMPTLRRLVEPVAAMARALGRALEAHALERGE
jgi:hypothetical protein